MLISIIRYHREIYWMNINQDSGKGVISEGQNPLDMYNIM